MKVVSLFTVLAIGSLIAFSSCKKDTKDPEPENPATPATPAYTIPTTYNFANADFSASTKRIAMLGELTTYIRSTHTSTVATQPTLDAQKLKDMYANVNAKFSDAGLNTSGIQLKDQTGNDLLFQSELEANFDDAAAASIIAAANAMTSTASKGNKGKLITPARAILVDGNGFEYKEFAEKGIMGAVFYYQATKILNTIDSYDNTTLVNGATAQERAWDEAFGYFGVPVSFPTSTVGLKNWGSYANSVDKAIQCNTTMMNAFLKGRAAISNKDKTARDEAKKIVINTWEKVAAAKCINYMWGAKKNLSDVATLHHNLSEGYGFVRSFRYNSGRVINDADVVKLLGYFGTSLYDMDQADIDNTIKDLKAIFNIDDAELD
jgi:hypothetical protein